MGNLAGEFVARLFHSRTNAHFQHLSTRSFAAHKALNEYYDEVVDVADAFAEAYQGVYGLIGSFPGDFVTEKDPVTMLTALRKWIDENRAEITKRSELQNLIDEVVDLIDGTLYKLRFLS